MRLSEAPDRWSYEKPGLHQGPGWLLGRDYSACAAVKAKAPHPSPLPEGEGTDWGIFKNSADVKDLYRIHNRLGHSGRWTTPDTSVGSLSLGRGD
ncbi:hypothetical protein DMX02_10730 [Pseudomonas jessenii]|nr:hypothetical protein DMX02_10730 [Pseudomonas jessenii]